MPENIVAGIDKDDQVRIECEVKGLYKSNIYGGIVDTGFSGSLALPLEIAVSLGLEKIGAGSVMLADGSTKIMPLFVCKVRIGSIEQDADTLIMGSDVLLGMGILDQFSLCLTPSSGTVTLEPAKGAKEIAELTGKYADLVDTMKRLTGRITW